MKHAMLASGLMLALACTGAAVAQTEMTRTTTTTTTTISPEERTTFRQWVVTDHHPSIAAENFNVTVGAVLPSTVTFYEVPNMRYRYTVVNDRRVLVDPGTRRIVEVE